MKRLHSKIPAEQDVDSILPTTYFQRLSQALTEILLLNMAAHGLYLNPLSQIAVTLSCLCYNLTASLQQFMGMAVLTFFGTFILALLLLVILWQKEKKMQELYYCFYFK